MNTTTFRKSSLFRAIAFTVLVAFIGLLPTQPSWAQVAIVMPPPGRMIHVTDHFEPPQMVGIKIDLKDPFSFDFIMDQGERPMSDFDKKEEFNKIIKYFLVSLAMPNKEMWVNLSPYESKRIIPEVFAQTEMGRDLLAQDYILKQFTASLMYPEDGLGKKFWDKIYQQAQNRFGTTDISVNTFNKVWIVADKADIYQNGDTAFLVDSHLKVMLEQDYMAIEKNREQFGNVQAIKDDSKDARGQMASAIVREIIIPAIEKEVNDGKSFAAVRQVYNAEIMATWFKKTLRESLLGQVFANKSKVAGQKVSDPQAIEKIYKQYLRAYKKGVFDYIKEDAAPDGRIIPRKYFSGGAEGVNEAIVTTLNPETVASSPAAAAKVENFAKRAIVYLKEKGRIVVAAVAFTTFAGSFLATPATSVKAEDGIFAGPSYHYQGNNTHAADGGIFTTGLPFHGDKENIRDAANPTVFGKMKKSLVKGAKAVETGAEKGSKVVGKEAKFVAGSVEERVKDEGKRAEYAGRSLFNLAKGVIKLVPSTVVQTDYEKLQEALKREQDANDTLEVLQGRFNRLRWKQGNMDDLNDKLQKAQTKYQQAIEEAKNRATETQAVITAEQVKNQKMQAKVKEAEAVSAENVELREKLEALKVENQKMQDDLNTAQKNLKKLQGDLDAGKKVDTKTIIADAKTTANGEIKMILVLGGLITSILAIITVAFILKAKKEHNEIEKNKGILIAQSNELQEKIKLLLNEEKTASGVVEAVEAVQTAEIDAVKAVEKVVKETIVPPATLASRQSLDEIRRSLETALLNASVQDKDHLTAEAINKAKGIGQEGLAKDAYYVYELRSQQSNFDHMRFFDKSTGYVSDKAKNVGGINLSDERLTINIKVDGAGMPLPARFQDKAMMNLNGLTSIIRRITPVTPENVPALYELVK